MVCTIAPPSLRYSRPWTRTWAGLRLPPESAPYDVQGFPFGPARNIALKACVEGGWGYLLFIDSDVIPPVEGVMWLLETGYDFVGGNYHKRGDQFQPVACNMQRDEKGVWVRQELNLNSYPPGSTIPVVMLGMGFTLISRRCLEAVWKKYPRPFEWGLDIAPIPDGNGGSLPGLSEDYTYCLRAKEVGFQPMLCLKVQCQHEIDNTASYMGGVKTL